MGIDRIFMCKPDQDISILIPDNDNLPLDQFNNAMEIYRDPEKVLIRVRIDGPCLRDMAEQTGMDPLSMEAVQALGIVGSYIGETLEDVFARWPELAGDRTVGWDEYLNSITAPIVSRAVWA